MKVGVFVPLVGDPASLPETLAVAATTAEAAGFHSLWFAEHVVLFDAHRSRYPYSEDGAFPIAGEDGLLEPFVAIAYAAAITSRIRLGTGVCLVPQRSAIYTAKQVADCDVLSRGRVDFGVGIGWLREEFEALDMDFDDRAERCRDAIGAMRSLWTDALSSHDGALIRFPELRMFPKPVQQPHPPIIFGGAFPYGARRALRYGDGWMPHRVRKTYADVNALLPKFREMAKEANRDLASVPVTIWGAKEDEDLLKRDRDDGVERIIVSLDSAKADKILPELDRWAKLARAVAYTNRQNS